MTSSTLVAQARRFGSGISPARTTISKYQQAKCAVAKTIPEQVVITTLRRYWKREVLVVATVITLILVVPPALWGGAAGLHGREIIIAAGYTFVAALAAGFLLRPDNS